MTEQETKEVVANCDHLKHLKFSRYLSNAFTEHGAIMAASILNSSRAIGVSIYVVRAFIKLRELFFQHKELNQKLEGLEKKVSEHDESIKSLVNALYKMTNPPIIKKNRKIGFNIDFERLKVPDGIFFPRSINGEPEGSGYFPHYSTASKSSK